VVQMLDLGHRLVGHVATEQPDVKREALPFRPENIF
jgi:hypothetical protein